MDFHSFSRKELQRLCKKNKIPANITNVAMADALAALQHVEGLDEFLNQREGDAASTQRKPVGDGSEVRVSARPQRGHKAGIAEAVIEQENKDDNIPVTPAVVPGSRRRAPAVYSCRKKEAEMVEDDGNQGQGYNITDLPKTPAAAPTSRTRATGRSVRTRNDTTAGTSVQPAYNTRRSVRLLQKTMSKMSLADTEDFELDKTDDVSEEFSNVSQQVEDLSETEKGSTVVSYNTNELEVSSLDKKEDDHECQSHDSGSEVNLVSGTENDVAGLQAEHEQKEDLGKVDSLEVEPSDSNLKLKGSYDTCDDSNEAGSELLSEVEESGVFSELEDDLPVFEIPASMEVTDQDVAAVPVVVPDDASMDATNQDVTASSVSPKDSVECNEGDDRKDEKNETENLNIADGNYFQNFEPLYDVDEKAADVKGLASSEGVPSGEHQEEELEAKPDQSEKTEKMDHASEVNGTSSAILEDASFENSVAVIEESREETEQMDYASDDTRESSAILDVEDDASSNSENSLADIEVCTESKPEQSEESMTETKEMDHASDVTGESASIPPEEVDAKDTSSENTVSVIGVFTDSSADEKESMDYASDDTCESSAILDVEEDASSENSLADIEVCTESKPEQSEESMTETKEMDHASDVTGASASIPAEEVDAKDTSSENTVPVTGVFTESFADEKESMEAEKVTPESLLLDISAHEAEAQKDNSEKLGAKVQAAESVECAAGEDTAEIPLVDQQVSVESAGSSIDSCSSDGILSMISSNSNKLVDFTIPKQESRASAETMTVAPIHEQKSSIPIESVVSGLAQSESESKVDVHNATLMKENLTSDELGNKSLRELRKIFKNLTLDGKSNCKTDNVGKDKEKKRTALQVLPQNPMATGESSD